MGNEELKSLVFLVVDDDGQVRHILSEYLRSFGIENVLQAKDGFAALKFVQNHQQRIDFIISDWEMPQVDGLVLLKAVRNDQNREGVKFIMVSSQSSRERMKISKAAHARVDAYVVKPFRAKILHEKIQTLLDGKIDGSVAEFEGILSEVPSNKKPPEKKSPGKVFVKGKAAAIPKTIKAKPSDPPDHYNLNIMTVPMIITLSKSYLDAGKFDKAIRLCLDAHFIYPSSAEILFNLGVAYSEKGDLDSALDQLKKAIKIDPYHVDAQTLFADLDLQRKTG